MILNKLFNYR